MGIKITELFYEIGADTKKLRRDLDKAEGETKEFNEQMDVSIARLGALATGATAAGAALGAMAKRGGRVIGVQRAFARSTGESAAALGQLRAASGGIISDFELMQLQNQAMALGAAETTSQFSQMVAVSRDLGRALGLDASRALDSLTTGIARQSRMILDNLGITVSVTEANERYAEQLGVTASQLSEAQQREAFRAEALRQARETVDDMGGATETAADEVGRLVTELVNLRDELASLAAMGGVTTSFFGGISQMIAEFRGENLDAVSAVEAMQNTLARIGDDRRAVGTLFSFQSMDVQRARDELARIESHTVGWTRELQDAKDQLEAAEEVMELIWSRFSDLTSEKPEVEVTFSEEIQAMLDNPSTIIGSRSLDDTVRWARRPQQIRGPSTGPMSGVDLTSAHQAGIRQGPSGGGADIAAIDSAMRGVSSLADAAGDLSEESRGAVRGISDVTGGLVDLTAEGASTAQQIGGAMGLAGGLASLATTLFSLGDATRDTAQVVRESIEDIQMTIDDLRGEGLLPEHRRIIRGAERIIDTPGISLPGDLTAREAIERRMGFGDFQFDLGELHRAGITDAMIDEMAEQWDQLLDLANTPVDELGNAAADAAADMREMSRVINSPQGFKVALDRFSATEGRTAGPGATDTGAPGDGGVVMHGDVHLHGIEDPRAFLEELEREARRGHRSGSRNGLSRTV